MNFSSLKERHMKWQDILVIGRTTEHDGRRAHFVGMTLSDSASLYIIAPYIRTGCRPRKGALSHRKMLRENESHGCSELHCSELCIGGGHFRIQGGTGSPLTPDDPGMLQLFFDMMSAGWIVPEWLEDMEWDDLMLVALDIADVEKLPRATPQTPMTITHRPDPVRHIIEKTVTLVIGKCRSFCFLDHHGETVQCHINAVTLIDVWKAVEKELDDPGLAERSSPEQLAQAKEQSRDALGQSCPEGMCYIGIEYECSRPYSLTFYSKQYLSARPGTHSGSAHFLVMRAKPDQETGSHGLPLKGCVIETPVPPDTTRIPAELFSYHEQIAAWTEQI